MNKIDKVILAELNQWDLSCSEEPELKIELAKALGRVVKNFSTSDVVGQSEQLVVCKKCGSSEMYQYTKTKDKCEECGNIQDY